MSRQTTLPRRRLLAGALAVPVAATAAVVPAIATADPDAKLLELGRQHAEADARYNDLNERCEAAHAAAIAAYPPAPEALRVRDNDRHDFASLQSDGLFNSDAIRRFRACAPGGGILWPQAAFERFDARRAEVLAAWDRWMDAQERARATVGLRELERQLDAQGYALTDLEHHIFALPAKTPAGWRLKAQLARRVVMDPYPESDGTYEDKVIRSLLADLTDHSSPETAAQG